MSVALIVLMTAVFIVCGAVSASADDGWIYLIKETVDFLKPMFIPFEKLKKEAENGDPEAQYTLGYLYLVGDEKPELYKKYKVHKNYEKAFNLFKQAARASGHKGAQFQLGYMYYRGLWVSQDKSEALKWYRKSAEQDYAKAQYNLGVMYYNGYGVR